MRKIIVASTLALSAYASQATAQDNLTIATAQGFDLVDGAVVCGSLDMANYLAGQINMARHARRSLPADLRRQAALVNGYDVGQEPRLTEYGCVLVPTGTSLTIESGNIVPVVSGKLPNGRRFSGVTLPAMVLRSECNVAPLLSR